MSVMTLGRIDLKKFEDDMAYYRQKNIEFNGNIRHYHLDQLDQN